MKLFATSAILMAVFSLAGSLLANQTEITAPSKADFLKKSRKMHVPFIANQGQIDGRVRYYASTFGGTVFVTHTGDIVYSLPGAKEADIFSCNGASIRGVAMEEEIVGGKIEMIRGEGKATTIVNYLKGNDPSQWKTDISTYETVSLGEIYKGITLKLRAYGNNVEKLFYLAPGASPELIKMKLNGAESLRVNEGGALEVLTEPGIVTFTKPYAYQEIDGERRTVEAAYFLQNAHTAKSSPSLHRQQLHAGSGQLSASESPFIYGFALGKYDTTKELVIDPLLASTYIGGSESDVVNSIAIGANSNVYITGATFSSDFPITTGAYDSSNSTYAEDVFVAKFDSDITELIASTFLGGSALDIGKRITINPEGNIFVVGYTSSSDFPTTSGTSSAYSTSFNGGPYDVFVSVLDKNLTTLHASTYLGGSSSDMAYSAVIDPNGNVYIAGYTSSSDFPATSNAYNTSYNQEDAFIAKLDGGLTSLTAATYLSGSAYDRVNSIAIDAEGAIYVCGRTSSSDFPTTTDAYDTTYNDTSGYAEDVFVAKLDAELKSLIASTYLGGITYDYGNAIAIDDDKNVLVAGSTGSSAFPTTSSPKAYDTTTNGGTDAFISKLNENLSKLITSTFLGGSSEDSVEDIFVDSTGNIYVTGKTGSSDFPATTTSYDTSYSGDSDAFVAKFNSDLMNMLAATLLGGSSSESGNAIAINSGGYVYVGGITESDDFPVIDTGAEKSYDTTYNDKGSVFLSKLDSNLSSALPVVTTSAATGITDDAATLKGTVNANDFETEVWFEYDTTSGYYGTTTSSQSVSGSDDTSVTADLSGLSDDTTYYFRIVAENREGTSYGDELSFSTLSINEVIPIVTTSSATNITIDSATLKGTVNANDSSATAWFEYDTTSGYYGTTTSSQSISGSDDTSVTADLSGLSDDTTYYFRIVAENSKGVSYGDEASFSTLSITDKISGSVIDLSGSAVAEATVQCKGKSTKIKKLTATGESGSFEFSGLEADTYTITAKKKGYKKAKQTVELEEYETDEIEIELVLETKKNKKK